MVRRDFRLSLRDLFRRFPILLAETNGNPTAEQLRPLLPGRCQLA
jgi:hypothetical protein